MKRTHNKPTGLPEVRHSENTILAGALTNIRLEFRPYQQRIVQKALQMFAGTYRDRSGRLHRECDSVMLNCPTGSGKTVMGLLLCAHMQQTHGFRVGWVAMRRNLLKQCAQENSNRFGLEIEFISMFDKNPPPIDFLVVDEAHHDGTMSMARIHGQIKPQKVLGLSATPYRTDRVKLCFQQVIADVGLQTLVQDGYLAQYHHYTLPEYTPLSVADFYHRQADRWGKSLLFFHRMQQCLDCQQELARRGIAAEIVSANSNRDRQIQQFAEGPENSPLISMAILAEGFDLPALKTVFCRPSGKACTIQMGGRVFRPHPEIPFKQVVQCKDTRHPFLKTATPKEQYVWTPDGWRSLKINEKLSTMSRNALQLVASSPAELPPLVARNRPRRRTFRRTRSL